MTKSNLRSTTLNRGLGTVYAPFLYFFLKMKVLIWQSLSSRVILKVFELLRHAKGGMTKLEEIIRVGKGLVR